MIRLTAHPELHVLFEALGYAVGFAAYSRARARSADVVNDQQRWSVIGAAFLGALVGSRLLEFLEQAPAAHLAISQLFVPSGGKTIVGGLLGGWLALRLPRNSLEFDNRLVLTEQRDGAHSCVEDRQSPAVPVHRMAGAKRQK
jgi:phosphatidylglycerol:prolipoprotein diacylglycerol transferase